jgi:hypothetical protein
VIELNLTAYGYGVGLVMVGWFAGLGVAYAFSLARGIGNIPSGR